MHPGSPAFLRKRKRKPHPHPSAPPVPNANVAHAVVIAIAIVKVVVVSRVQKVRNNAPHNLALSKPSRRWRNDQSKPQPQPKVKSAPSAVVAVVDVIVASALSAPSVNRSNKH